MILSIIHFNRRIAIVGSGVVSLHSLLKVGCGVTYYVHDGGADFLDYHALSSQLTQDEKKAPPMMAIP
jgi:hypothetical protein